MRLRIVLGIAATLACASASEAAADDGDRAEVDGAAERDAPSPKHTHLVVRASAGGSSRALFDAYVVGAEADVGAGLDTAYGSFGLDVRMFGGVVQGGFTALQGMVGFDLEWPVGVFRFGAEPRIGYLQFGRLTSERDFGAYTFGIAARASIDVLRADGIAVAIGVRPTADVAAALGNDGATADGAAPLVGGSAFCEVRWRSVE